MKAQKYLGEFIGTFILGLTVMASIHSGQPVIFIAALTLVMLVYALGAISGAHFNPAVTIGLFTDKKISSLESFGYIISQFAGAGTALLMAMTLKLTAENPPITENWNWIHSTGELIGTFVLVFSISSVVHKKTETATSGLTIGLGLLAGLIISSSTGALGILNPAIALGLGATSLTYLISPIIGAIAGVWAYKALNKNS